MKITKTKISPKIMLRSVDNVEKQKPLILLFSWLYSTPAAVDKYCMFYHERKMDVLCMDVELKHFLRPSTGKAFAVQILNYLKDMNSQNNAYVVHAFSIGAYLYSIVLLEIERNPEYHCVSKKIRGQIFDSITIGGLGRMSEGIARFTANPVLRTLLKSSTSAYFWLTKKHTVDFYEVVIDQFVNRPLRTPVQFFYSLNDPMASPESMQEIIDLWRDDPAYKMDIAVKCWEKSIHSRHLKKHPEEYTQTLQQFLLHTGQLHSSEILLSKL